MSVKPKRRPYNSIVSKNLITIIGKLLEDHVSI